MNCLRHCAQTQHVSVIAHILAVGVQAIWRHQSCFTHAEVSASGGSCHWPRRLTPPPEEPGAREPLITRLTQQRHGFMRTYITDTLPRLSLFTNNMHVHISRPPNRVNRAGEAAHLETRPQYLKALSAPLSTCKMRRLVDAIRAEGRRERDWWFAWWLGRES